MSSVYGDLQKEIVTENEMMLQYKNEQPTQPQGHLPKKPPYKIPEITYVEVSDNL